MAIFQVGQRLTDNANVDVTVERVASGGFGDVAMGPDKLHEGRWVALKALRPDLIAHLNLQPGSTAAYAAAEAQLRANFLREALTWCGLWWHPNLVPAAYVTQINGELMLVLNYAEQGSLRDLFTTERREGTWLPLDAALNLAQQIAAGLVALHTPAPELLRPEPIVHRDLKPENILLTQGYAQISDFGLAKMVAEAVTQAVTATAPTRSTPGEAALSATSGAGIVATATQAYPTQRGQVLGTPAYIAPEQWLDASQAGEPADAYAFGLIVAELVTGRHPLLPLNDPELTLADCRQAHLAGRPIPLRQLGVDVFANECTMHDAAWGARQDAALGQVEGLVARLLAKQEAARPTVAETLAELQAAAGTLGDEPPYTPPEVYSPTEEHQMAFWQGWASSYEAFGLHAEALPRIERALALAPEDPNVLNDYAAILAGLGRVEEALVVYSEALERLPAEDRRGRAVLGSNIGNHLMSVGRYAEAEAAFAEATRLTPTFAEAWHNRALNAGKWALAERAAGQVGAARAHVEAGLAYIERALKLNSAHPSYRQGEQALRQLREALRRQG